VAGYQRLVSYIYLYDKGIKVKNSGFAKIECKDNILRIKMSLKGAFNSNYEQWKVYLLAEEKNELTGVYIGEIKGKGNSAEFQMFTSSENIGGTGKNFEELKGLSVISTGNKKYATFWKDTAVSIENFRVYGDEASAVETKYLDNVVNINSEVQKNQLLEAMSVEAAEEANEKTEEYETLKEQENLGGMNEIQEKILRQENFEESSLNENWNQFLEQYRQVHPFSERDNIQCIRIELKDLKILPRAQWFLSNNSFVLHGYYNYQYLILGKIDSKFILGVPGIFCNKEKLVANLFGFNDFKAAQASDYKTGRFGYWYKYI